MVALPDGLFRLDPDDKAHLVHQQEATAPSRTVGQQQDAAFLQSVVVPNAGVFAYVVAFGEILIGLGLIFGCFTGAAALFGLFMNVNFMLSGVVDPNLITAVETLFLIFALSA